MNLSEQYRPRTWDGVIAQPKAVEYLRSENHGGNAYWITGASGTGKTTIARLIAADFADEYCISELDATKLTVSALDNVERETQFRPLGRGNWVYIVNEAHALRKDVITRLLTMLDPVPEYVCWVFTTICENTDEFEAKRDAIPFLSRTIPVPLARRDLAKPFAEYLRSAAQAAGKDGQPIERYVNLVKDCRNNLREAFMRVQRGEMKA